MLSKVSSQSDRSPPLHSFCASCRPGKVSRSAMCTPCREWLRLTEKRRYEKATEGTVRFGDAIPCRMCGQQITRTCGPKAYCGECLPIHLRQWSEAKRRRLGVPQIGEMLSCDECKTSFARRNPRHKFCDVCRARGVSTRRSIAARRRLDPAFRLSNAIKCGMYDCIKGRKNRRSWQALVGYSLDELKRHLERQFTRGMTWANYGEWHVDHILPLSSFSFQAAEDADFQAAWALTNLRPLWSGANIQKSDRRTLLL